MLRHWRRTKGAHCQNTWPEDVQVCGECGLEIKKEFTLKCTDQCIKVFNKSCTEYKKISGPYWRPLQWCCAYCCPPNTSTSNDLDIANIEEMKDGDVTEDLASKLATVSLITNTSDLVNKNAKYHHLQGKLENPLLILQFLKLKI